MSYKESEMKFNGEYKIWSTLFSSKDTPKEISSTQDGQQMILKESIRIYPLLKDWIDNKSSKRHRTELKSYFKDEDFLLTKIVEIHFSLVSRIYIELGRKSYKTRHRSINLIRNSLMSDLSFEMVWRFVEVIVESSRFLGVKRENNTKHKNNTNLYYTCSLRDEVMSKLSDYAANAFYPTPMSKPPLNWGYDEIGIYGGYHSYTYELIKARGRKVNYKDYSPEIFKAVNYIQSVPWKVNRELVNIIERDLKKPIKEDFIETEFPIDDTIIWDKEKCKELSVKDLKINEVKKDEFKKSAALYTAEKGDYVSEVGKYRATLLALKIAKQHFDEIIYFPHTYDFRGRIYPLPIGINPQGSDKIKSMLEYGEGEVLSERGKKWMWAYLASLYGDDKLDFEDRIKRGKELINVDYKDAEEPYQFLAHQIELKKFLKDPNYKVKARIHLDACNSGSQFTSAMTRDLSGCLATNVIPTYDNGKQVRQDAYLLIAEKAIHSLESLLELEVDRERLRIYKLFLKILKSDGRKICKKPVMVSNYGGTAGGRADILYEVFRELKLDRQYITRKNAVMFSNIIGDAIHGVLNGGKAFEQYIQKMNNIIAKQNKPVIWHTSDGFKVVHQKKKEAKKKQVTCILPGSRRPTTINLKTFSNKMSALKMKSAISPNYVHSLDAEFVRRVALELEKIGIKYSDWIHDSFGCHPNHVDKMLEITKDVFKFMMEANPLKKLDEELISQINMTKSNIKLLKQVSFPDFEDFEYNNDDNKIALDSDWFFS